MSEIWEVEPSVIVMPPNATEADVDAARKLAGWPSRKAVELYEKLAAMMEGHDSDYDHRDAIKLIDDALAEAKASSGRADG